MARVLGWPQYILYYQIILKKEINGYILKTVNDEKWKPANIFKFFNLILKENTVNASEEPYDISRIIPNSKTEILKNIYLKLKLINEIDQDNKLDVFYEITEILNKSHWHHGVLENVPDSIILPIKMLLNHMTQLDNLKSSYFKI